jgi:hypothetical protein
MTIGTTESDAPRYLSYEGFSFLPTSAALSLFATTSLLVTMVADTRALPAAPRYLVGILLFIMTVAALIHSVIGAALLLARGLAKSGTLVIGPWRCTGTALGVMFLHCYLAPWGMAVLAYCFSGILR